ncbi:MAG TPA: hypothetical protein PLP29_06750 [Candidatus Ozemobacteraceae bacterium]|nr:hypothetical protein [Candidatus Ozemobacteraceae bacterium]
MKHVQRIVGLTFLFVAALVAAFAAGPLPDVIVAGEPPITSWAVLDHVRLMEFVLDTRLTTGQKETFLATLKKECAGMDREGRAAFLEARQLVASMAVMTPDQRESVREVLREDFENTAAEEEADPAAQLYMQVRDAAVNAVASQGSDTVTLQDIEALAEYVAFVRAPEQPAPISAADRDVLRKAVTEGFATASEEARRALSGFADTWHLLRAGWAAGDAQAHAGWAGKLKEATGRAGFGKTIADTIDSPLWEELKRAAAGAGETAAGWTATPTLIVW